MFISSNILYSAMSYFKSKGYKFITVPLLVDKDVSDFTLPKGKTAEKHCNEKVYVGSAEQSIYQMIKDGYDFPEKVLAITPCQRNEESLDDLHLKMFLKIELITFGSNNSHVDILNDVKSFYSTVYDGEIKVVEIEDGTRDLEINDIEVGSYGTRNYMGRTVNYGTGLALPRFQQAINHSSEQ